MARRYGYFHCFSREPHDECLTTPPSEESTPLVTASRLRPRPFLRSARPRDGNQIRHRHSTGEANEPPIALRRSS